MSMLKRQLIGLLPELRTQAKKIKCEEARYRWYILLKVVESSRSVRAACAKEGVSEDFFRKWCKRLIQSQSVDSLRSIPRCPRRSPRKLKRIWEERIRFRRESLPFEGCDRIAHNIFEVFNRQIAPSTVNKVLNRLGLICRRKAKKLTKKHLKRYRRPLPGYLQMDFKYVPFKVKDRQYYQLSCVDHHSSWRLIRIYEKKDLYAVECFLQDLERECPFAIMQIQTDNDLAFTHKFWKLIMGFDPTFEHPLAEWCKENEVEQKLIPVGEKELNGKVENTHKQDDREFFSQINPQNLEHLQMLSIAYERRWNEQRKTRSLGRKTPLEAVEFAYVRVLCWFKIIGISLNNGVIKIPKLKTRKIKNRKRKTIYDRYLQWMEEDAKKYGNS